MKVTSRYRLSIRNFRERKTSKHTVKCERFGYLHRRSLVLALGGAMASAVARAYNGGLGAVPPAGSTVRAPGKGVWGAKPRPPEAEHNYTFH